MLLRNNSSVSKCLGGSQNYQHPGRTQRKWRSVGFVLKRYICAFIRLQKLVCLRKKQKQKGRVTHNDLQAVASIVQQSFVNPVNAGQKFGHQQRSTEKKSLVIRIKLFLNFVI